MKKSNIFTILLLVLLIIRLTIFDNKIMSTISVIVAIIVIALSFIEVIKSVKANKTINKDDEHDADK